jgi:hypothetical protein
MIGGNPAFLKSEVPPNPLLEKCKVGMAHRYSFSVPGSRLTKFKEQSLNVELLGRPSLAARSYGMEARPTKTFLPVPKLLLGNAFFPQALLGDLLPLTYQYYKNILAKPRKSAAIKHKIK